MSLRATISAQAPRRGRSHDVLGVDIQDLSRPEALAFLIGAIQRRAHVKLAFCNAHTANLAWADPAYREALSAFTVLPDGVGVDLAARLLGGRPFAANLNGTDFMPELLAASPAPMRIAMIGARPGVAERAAVALKALDGRHEFGPILHGFADAEEQQAWLDALAATPADVILVAMGNPLQEKFIAGRLTAAHGSVAAGVGALFDFLAGDVRRAPESVRAMRLEWLWRLMLEPRRLFRRYVVGNPLFLIRLLAARLGVPRT